MLRGTILGLIAVASAARAESPLARSPSPYLREAAAAKVAWRAWGDAALSEAKRLHRPILVDVGAGWCHWCHVMDQSTYGDDEVARRVNARYVAVKVDRDLSPDADARWQRIGQRVFGASGWPLTVWLTEEGEPYHVATYVPAARMVELLDLLAGGERDPARTAARRAELEQIEAAAPAGSAALDPKAADRIGASILARADPVHGGVGGAPKFPSGAQVRLALALADRHGEAGGLEQHAVRTLDAIAAGGVRDQVGGGFHRYATDAAWRVPHFEKLLSVEADLLAAFVCGYRATGSAIYREVVAETVELLASDAGSDRARGGLWASQDADAQPGDDGGYWTWTEAELRAAGGDEAVQRFGARAMPRDLAAAPERNVLYLPHLALHPRALIVRLRAARGKRRAPAIDRTKYAAWNGLAISALLEADAALALPAARATALAALDLFLDPARRFAHALTPDGRVASPRGERRLDDLANLAIAALDGYQTTGRPAYLAAARALLDEAERTLSRPDGRFADSTDPAAPPPAPDDVPVPSPSSRAALALSRLAAIDPDAPDAGRRRARAEKLLAAHAEGAERAGPFAAAWAEALVEATSPRPTVVVVAKRADDPAAVALRAAARAGYRPGLLVRPLVSAPHVRYPLGPNGEARAYVCTPGTCAPPTSDPAELRKLVEVWGR